jgi:hypothetical protein
MPIIINELVLKATVDARVPEPRQAPSTAAPAEDRDALVAAIVEEVLRVLDRAKER